MQVSNTLTVNVIFCPLKANTWRLKNKSCNRNEPKEYTNTWQIIEVSNSTKRDADNSGNHANLYALLKFAITRSSGSSFLLITQYINKSEAAKRLKDRKENGKCANATNSRSRVWPVYFIHHQDIFWRRVSRFIAHSMVYRVCSKPFTKDKQSYAQKCTRVVYN